MAETTEYKGGDVFKIWTDSYLAISKIWEDSYLKLYKPWLEATGELFQKAVEISKNALPEKYKEFYDEWFKIYSTNKIPTPESNREILEKVIISAEESNNIYKAWIVELEENSNKTKEVLNSEQDPAKYKEIYDMWIKSYSKIFDELLTIPFRVHIREIFEKYTGMPDIYSDTFVQISNIWKDSYTKLYGPWMESMQKLYEKSSEISKGNANTETYKEFYDIWLNTYQQTYGKFFDFQSVKPSREAFENFVKSTDIYLDLYKSWISALEKLSLKAKEIMDQSSDQEAYKEFYNLWAKTYQKSFDSFFENTPTVGPFKNLFEPVKNAAKIYADSFARISEIWGKSFSTKS